MGLLDAGFIVYNLGKSYEPLLANQFGSLAPEINKLMKITNNDDENWKRYCTNLCNVTSINCITQSKFCTSLMVDGMRAWEKKRLFFLRLWKISVAYLHAYNLDVNMWFRSPWVYSLAGKGLYD